MSDIVGIIALAFSVIGAGVITWALIRPERDMDEEWFVFTHAPDTYREFYRRESPLG